LGHEIKSLESVDDLVKKLISGEIVAVASGRAEFGPRALGNRSLLADPRLLSSRDKLNTMKAREDFRPVAPAILVEYAKEWFDMNYESPYMQYTPKCKKPELIPAAVHMDGTSRVQTVSKEDDTILRPILERFYELTGVPVLLNTSMNIKGSPLVNTKADFDLWSLMYGGSGLDA
jgi:carbamoyltransferase